MQYCYKRTDRLTSAHTDLQVHRQTYKRTGRLTSAQADSQAHRQTYTCTDKLKVHRQGYHLTPIADFPPAKVLVATVLTKPVRLFVAPHGSTYRTENTSLHLSALT